MNRQINSMEPIGEICFFVNEIFFLFFFFLIVRNILNYDCSTIRSKIFSFASVVISSRSLILLNDYILMCDVAEIVAYISIGIRSLWIMIKISRFRMLHIKSAWYLLNDWLSKQHFHLLSFYDRIKLAK